VKALGTLTLIVLAVALVGGLVLGVRSIPDIKRYLKIRAM